LTDGSYGQWRNFANRTSCGVRAAGAGGRDRRWRTANRFSTRCRRWQDGCGTLGQIGAFYYYVTESAVQLAEINATLRHCMSFENSRATLTVRGLAVRLTGIGEARGWEAALA